MFLSVEVHSPFNWKPKHFQLITEIILNDAKNSLQYFSYFISTFFSLFPYSNKFFTLNFIENFNN